MKRSARILTAAWSRVTLILWSLWWGGLTFYSGIVVRIGADIVGTTDQGFITQRVSLWFYGLAVVYLASIAADIWRDGRLFRRITWLIAIALMPPIWLLHGRLSSMLDPESRSVIADGDFYSWHATYLWLISAQWACGIVLTPPLNRGHASVVGTD